MLPSDLVSASVSKGAVRPRYLNPDTESWRGLATELIEIHQRHVGKTRGELSEALKDLEGATPRFRVMRGLAHLLGRRTKIGIDSPLDPSSLRREVFEASAAAHPSATTDEGRTRILEEVADKLGIAAGAIENALFADLKHSHVVESFKDIEPVALLDRYNLALAQGLLLKATALRIEITLSGRLGPARFRQLFRYLKFHRLMHRIKIASQGKGKRGKRRYAIELDGPMSLFKQSTKYGKQLADFLPALLLCENWTAEADVVWGEERKSYVLAVSPDDGLVTHYRNRGVYLSETQTIFQERFDKLAGDWSLTTDDPLLPLAGQDIWIPDFKATHTDGREAHIEVIGYWRSDYLARRLALLASHGPPNLVLCVSDRLKVDDGELDALPVEIVRYKRVVPTKEVIRRLEVVALEPT